MTNKLTNSNKSEEQPNNPLLSDDSSDEEAPENNLRVIEEEKCGSIPGSTVATAMALAGARAQANPTIERGPPHRRKKQLIKKSMVDTASQTRDQEKQAQ